jgi:GNAT superfamily N-acetyltransferase
MALPHLFNVSNSPLKVKMVTTAYEGMTVAYLRYKVFVEEQHIHIDEEFDGSDAISVSFLLFLDHVPVGTMRYYKDEQGHIHPGRIAILKTYRNQGFGKKLLQSSALRFLEGKESQKSLLKKVWWDLLKPPIENVISPETIFPKKGEDKYGKQRSECACFASENLS